MKEEDKIRSQINTQNVRDVIIFEQNNRPVLCSLFFKNINTTNVLDQKWWTTSKLRRYVKNLFLDIMNNDETDTHVAFPYLEYKYNSRANRRMSENPNNHGSKNKYMVLFWVHD